MIGEFRGFFVWVLCSFCGWSSDNGDIFFARADVLSLVIYSPSGEEISDGFCLFFRLFSWNEEMLYN